MISRLCSAEFPQAEARALVRLALSEDVGSGDVTSLWTIPEAQRQIAVLIAKEAGVIAGLPVIPLVFEELSEFVEVRYFCDDGDPVKPGQRVVEISGATRALLTGERTVLNILQQLSGVATVARRFADAVAGTGTRILDTRKTLPGMRRLQKYAVRIGGAHNHRMGLHDMVLIKDNHIKACGGVLAALEQVRRHNHRGLRVEIEVENLDDLKSLLGKGVDVIMLDNMSAEMMAEAIRLVRESGDPVQLEASGNMDLERVRQLATLGLDYISVGALTHSVKALDISMRIL